MKRYVLMALVLCFTIMPIVVQADSKDDYFSVLLLGMDEGAEEALVPSKYGRTDAMMLVSFNKNTCEIRMLTVERDYRTDILESGPNKLCVVCYFEGPEASLRAVNELLDLDVPHYALITPSGMEGIVDALGGIEVEITDEDLAIYLEGGIKKAFKKTGLQQLTGAQARAYVRTRIDGEGELKEDSIRNNRQHKALTAMLKKALAGGKNQMLNFGMAAIRHVETDLNILDVLSLAEPLLFGDLQAPEFSRTPMTETKNETIKLHRLVVPIDPTAEIQKVRDFLYPDLTE